MWRSRSLGLISFFFSSGPIFSSFLSLSIPCFFPSFLPEMFIKYLLCVRHCPRHQKHIRKQNKITTPREFVFQELNISTVFSWCHFANILIKVNVVVVQSLCHVRLFVTQWTAAHQAPLSYTISQSMLKFLSTESVMLSIHIIRCYPLLLLPSIFPSISIFSSESALCIRWPKIIELRYQSFQ